MTEVIETGSRIKTRPDLSRSDYILMKRSPKRINVRRITIAKIRKKKDTQQQRNIVGRFTC